MTSRNQERATSPHQRGVTVNPDSGRLAVRGLKLDSVEAVYDRVEEVLRQAAEEAGYDPQDVNLRNIPFQGILGVIRQIQQSSE